MGQNGEGLAKAEEEDGFQMWGGIQNTSQIGLNISVSACGAVTEKETTEERRGLHSAKDMGEEEDG